MAEAMVRPARVDEFSVACDLRNEMVRELAGRSEDDRRPGWRERFVAFWGAQLQAGTGTALFLMDGERYVGMTFAYIPVTHRSEIYAEPYGYINHVYVAPAYRGRGYGRALMRGAIDWIRANGCGSARLVASEQGSLLYRSMGFSPVAMMEITFD